GGQLPDLLVLARVRAGNRRRPPARPGPDGGPAQGCPPPRTVRRGGRPQHRPAPRQFPAGVLAPRPDRGRGQDRAGRAAGGVRMMGYDVISIGGGGGGGTLWNPLAPSGKRILLLGRGDWAKREPHNWSIGDVFIDNRYISEDTWYDGETAKAFQPQVHYFVGGATKLYGAALH